MVQIPLMIEKIETRVDGSIKLIMSTRELSPFDTGVIFGMRNKQMQAMFKDADFSESDILALEKTTVDLSDFPNAKTPSQRLRAVVYLVWQQSGKAGGFNSYYLSIMEKIINHYKLKLDE